MEISIWGDKIQKALTAPRVFEGCNGNDEEKIEKLQASSSEEQSLLLKILDNVRKFKSEGGMEHLLQALVLRLELRRRFGQRLAKTVIEDQEAKQPAEAPKCPQCGEAMRYKDQKAAHIESRLGALAVERGYYYCARCKSGLFPPERTA